jgi:hypothetical protein
VTTSTTILAPSTDPAGLDAVLTAAARFWQALQAYPIPLKAVIGPKRVSLQIPMSSGSDVARTQIVEYIAALVGTEAGLVGDGITYAYEAAGTAVDGVPLHGFTFYDSVPEAGR